LRTGFVGQVVVHLDSVDSTNDVAKALAEQGTPEGTLVIADYQTAGRGRFDRRWLAPAGSSLLFSLVFYPPWPPADAFALNTIMSLATVEAIREQTSLPTAIKWPNDILIAGHKAGGILTECGIRGEHLDYVVVGLGLNVNFDPAAIPGIPPTATSLSKELGRPVDQPSLLQSILQRIDARYQQALTGGLAEVHHQWVAHLATLGQDVCVQIGTEQITGRAETVEPGGTLLVRSPDGMVHRITVGEVSQPQTTH